MFRNTFRNNRFAVACFALLSLIVVASPAFAWESEADLLATLKQKDASLFDKAIACKQLAVVGTEAAVPVLAEFLGDEKMSHYARYGLEPIPSPKVDEAFRKALSELKGRHLIGVINSIANRGKPEAIGPLAEKLEDTDRSVAKAAAHSIGRLGTPEGSRILMKSMSAEFAEAYLVCGKTLAEQGHTDLAIAMLDKLYGLEGAAQHIQLAATLQATVLRGKGAQRTLTAALTSDCPHTFANGLRTARLLKPSDAVPAVLAAMKGTSEPSQTSRLITLLGDLNEPAGLPEIVKGVKAEHTPVRIAAVSALAAVGKADHVTLLMDATSDESEEVSQQAEKALASLPGDAVDQAVLAALDDEAHQAVAIRMTGQRRITAAVPKLLPLIDGAHQLEVVAALGETIALDDLDVLGKRLGTDSPELREAVQKALHAACYRMPDRDATAAKLAGYMQGAPEHTVQFVMEELRQIGGAQALATVAKAARGDDATQQDYATRALGEWLDTSAAPVLLDLAKSEGSSKYGVRGLRGYIRLARQFSMPEEERLAICRTALQVSERKNEKKLVLQVLERYPSVEALKIAVDLAKDASLKTDAGQTAMAIVGKIGSKSIAVQELLSQIGYEPMKIEILKAEYGAGKKTKDVTEALQQQVRGFPLIVLPTDRYNTSFGGDPAPRTPKTLKVQYRIDGKTGEATFPENAAVLLPVPK